MRIGVLGINHKLADLQLRESLAKTCQKRFGANGSQHGEHYFVLLSTCNRTEIYFTSENLADTHTYILSILRSEVLEEFDQKLYSYFSFDCFLHLCRVTAGLDSAIVGETEIQGQVKNSYEYTTEYLSLPEELHYLFQKALMVGKKVRSKLPMQRGLPDLEHAILNAGLDRFSKLHETKILFVGASDINKKTLSFFKTKQIPNITLTNRSLRPTQELAKAYNLNILEWTGISEWENFDWIIFGTKSVDHLISKKWVADPIKGPKLIIDLSVPRNVDPLVGLSNPTVKLLNIDQINSTLVFCRNQLTHVMKEAEIMIFKITHDHMNMFRIKQERLLHFQNNHCDKTFKSSLARTSHVCSL